MHARSYRVDLILLPLDFPAIMGLGDSEVFTKTEAPHMITNKVVLDITKSYILTDMSTNIRHEVLKTQSVYEIPSHELKSREDAYEFYKNAILGLNEAYQYAQSQLPALPSILFPNQPIETYQREIDRIFDLLNTRN